VVEDAAHGVLLEAMAAEREARGRTDRGTLERLLGPNIRLDPPARPVVIAVEERGARRRNALPAVL
jgi:hypothetical protein